MEVVTNADRGRFNRIVGKHTVLKVLPHHSTNLLSCSSVFAAHRGDLDRLLHHPSRDLRIDSGAPDCTLRSLLFAPCCCVDYPTVPAAFTARWIERHGPEETVTGF